MNEQLPFFMQPAYFVLLFVCLWLLVCTVLSRISGWARLATQFRTNESQEGEGFSFVSGSVGTGLRSTKYRNCLFVTVNPRGIRLSLLFPFRFRHPPLFLPWAAIQSVTDQPLLKFFRHTVIAMKDPWPQIGLQGSAAAAVLEAHATYIKRSRVG